ncbi:NAD-dependent protein deacetylase [Paenibacillus sp. J31TS4]|uniref:NAD-dependent protein deacylase n=1 Tax=Paenibacillus sp. J31TS4 TaxID=2807195 RepID=UPI001B11F826|nr:NAD-dependent protein deacylase [Paenibacillus sp. J31TS4]GIP39499.1 NAD-dependent protein deacetylase [Paenibacillus sp. J31TS4]
MDRGQLEELKGRIASGARVVFFGGAGTSTESGIPDFRSASGLFGQGAEFEHPPEVMLSRSFFDRHPETFYRFYLSRMIYREAQPNAAHRALAELEKRGVLEAVVTQNIDGLHQRAGSRRVLELHGSVHRNRCLACGAFYPLETVIERAASGVPDCPACGGTIKPEVVLYEEPLDPDVLEQAADSIRSADVLIVGGTSLSVQPAAGLVRLYRGDALALINRTPTPYDHAARYRFTDSIGQVLQTLVD